MASTRGLVCLVLAACSTLCVQAQEKVYESELYWRQQAISSTSKVQEVRNRDQLWHDFCAARCQSGDPENASENAAKISDPQLRLFSHIAIAKHYYGTKREADCLAELKKAEAVALKDKFRFQLVDAYLDTLGDVKNATAYATAAGKTNPTYVAQTTVDALAKRGYFAEADHFVNWLQLRGLRKPTLYSRIARAAVKRSDVSGAKVVINKLSEREHDSIRLQLVQTLMDQKRSVEGQQMAAAIKSESYRTRARTVIEDSKSPPPNKAPAGTDWLRAAVRSGGRGQRRDHLFGEGIGKLLAAGEFGKVESAIGVWLQNAEANPIEETEGQFGRYNQTMRMANIQAHYARLGLARANAGETEAAKKDLAKARAVLPDLAGNWFMSYTLVPELLLAYLQVGEVETMKKTIGNLPEDSWVLTAHIIVERLFRVEDRESALEIARKASGNRKVCEVLIQHGEIDEVRKLMDEGTQGPALQGIGNKMMSTGRAETLRNWVAATESPQDRAYLSVGAYQSVVGSLEIPRTDKQKVLATWLKSVLDEMEAASFAATLGPNPGVFRPSSLPVVARRLSRPGSTIRLTSAVTMALQHHRHGQMQVTCYELADKQMCQRVYDGLTESMRDQFLIRGRFLVGASGRADVSKLRQLVFAALAKKKLDL